MSSFLRQLWERIWGNPPTPVAPPPQPQPEEEEEEEWITVPEVTVAELQQALTGDLPPFLVDIREPYEWQQVHMPAVLHIPMNDVPSRLVELPSDRTVVVICAHGSRSYDVAGYLIERGYQANSLAGGISGWARAGGKIRQSTARRAIERA